MSADTRAEGVSLNDEQIAEMARQSTYVDAQSSPVGTLLYLLQHETDEPVQEGLTQAIRELQQRRATPSACVTPQREPCSACGAPMDLVARMVDGADAEMVDAVRTLRDTWPQREGQDWSGGGSDVEQFVLMLMKEVRKQEAASSRVTPQQEVDLDDGPFEFVANVVAAAPSSAPAPSVEALEHAFEAGYTAVEPACEWHDGVHARMESRRADYLAALQRARETGA